MRYSVALLFLAPLVGMASVIANCPSVLHCSYTDIIVDDVVTIDLQGPGTFTLSETLVTDLSGPTPGFIGLANLTFIAGVYGPATALGTLGDIGCGVTGTGYGGPDEHAVVNYCSDGYVFFTDKILPVHMTIACVYNCFGEVFLSASFFEWNTETDEIRPLSVHFAPAPEPGSIWLSGAGLVVAGILFRKKRGSNLLGEWRQKQQIPSHGEPIAYEYCHERGVTHETARFRDHLAPAVGFHRSRGTYRRSEQLRSFWLF